MCHLVLINRSLGLEGGDREAEERILHTYTSYLMDTEKLGKYLLDNLHRDSTKL